MTEAIASEIVYGNLHLINARLPGKPGLFYLHLNDRGVIEAMGLMADFSTEGRSPCWDLGGDMLSLGGIDLCVVPNRTLATSASLGKKGAPAAVASFLQRLGRTGRRA